MVYINEINEKKEQENQKKKEQNFVKYLTKDTQQSRMSMLELRQSPINMRGSPTGVRRTSLLAVNSPKSLASRMSKLRLNSSEQVDNGNADGGQQGANE